jgi:hypothetical protein
MDTRVKPAHDKSYDEAPDAPARRPDQPFLPLDDAADLKGSISLSRLSRMINAQHHEAQAILEYVSGTENL